MSSHFDSGNHYYNQNNYDTAIYHFNQALNNGDNRAIGKLALAYYQKNDYTNAVNHCQKYIQDPSCKLVLGVCYYSNNGIPQNYEKSERLLKGAASEGNRLAKLNLAILFHTMENYEDEYFWCNEAANDNLESAKHRLHSIIINGRGIPPYRYKEYIEYLEQTLDSDVNSQFKLGLHYHYGQYGLPIDHNKAIKAYTKSANHGNHEALNNLGTIYERSDQIQQDLTKALDYYNQAVLKNNTFAPAVVNYANLLIKVKGDENKAHELLKSVENNPDAQAALARLYASSSGSFLDLEKAVEYQKKAAENGSVVALRDLADTSSGEEAEKWLHKAANSGDIPSQLRLGKQYEEKGEYTDALYWYNNASKKGNLEGQKLLLKLGQTVEQVLFV